MIVNVPFSIIENLQQLNKNDQYAHVLFQEFSKYLKRMSETKVRVLHDKTDVPLSDIIRILKELSKIGVGEFKTGRRGKESRIVWKFSAPSVGLLALGETSLLDPIEPAFDSETAYSEEPNFNEPVPVAHELGETELHFETHLFNLRPNLPISISLPLNLSQSEARRLSAWVGMLSRDG